MKFHQWRTILLILGSKPDEGICEATPLNQLGGPDCAYWTSCWPLAVYTGTCWGWMFSDIKQVMSVRKKLVWKECEIKPRNWGKTWGHTTGFMHSQVLCLKWWQCTLSVGSSTLMFRIAPLPVTLFLLLLIVDDIFVLSLWYVFLCLTYLCVSFFVFVDTFIFDFWFCFAWVIAALCSRTLRVIG